MSGVYHTFTSYHKYIVYFVHYLGGPLSLPLILIQVEIVWFEKRDNEVYRKNIHNQRGVHTFAKDTTTFPQFKYVKNDN